MIVNVKSMFNGKFAFSFRALVSQLCFDDTLRASFLCAA